MDQSFQQFTMVAEDSDCLIYSACMDEMRKYHIKWSMSMQYTLLYMSTYQIVNNV